MRWQKSLTHNIRGLLAFAMPLCLFAHYLLKIDIKSKEEIPFLNSLSITAIDYFAGSILALADERGLKNLNSQKILYEIVDTEPAIGSYLMVWPGDEAVRHKLKNIGQILLAGKDQSLLKIMNNSAIEKLNKLKVEVKRLSFNPIVITESDEEFVSIIKDSLIQEMADKVSADTILAVVKRLQNFQTRYSSTDSARACAQWLMNKFIGYGFDSVYTETFSVNYAPNVIAIKKGMVHL